MKSCILIIMVTDTLQLKSCWESEFPYLGVRTKEGKAKLPDSRSRKPATRRAALLSVLRGERPKHLKMRTRL